MEGHHLRGFGDGSKKVQEAEVIETFPGAMAEADEALSANPAVVERMGRVFRLVDGFESPYGLAHRRPFGHDAREQHLDGGGYPGLV